MHITISVSIEVDRIEGKFASKDELAEQIVGWIEGANESQLEGENGGQYEVTEWEVTIEEEPKPVRKSKPKQSAGQQKLPPEMQPQPRDDELNSFKGLAGLLP